MTDRSVTKQEEIRFFVTPRANHPERALLVVKCGVSSMGQCYFGLWQKPAGGITWQWDGNKDRPTITPSINCHGCGRHFSIVNGAVV